MNDIVDYIVAHEKSDAGKIVKLYAVVMLNYRQPLGDKAWQAMRAVNGNSSAFEGWVFLMGFNLGAAASIPTAKKYEDLIKDELKIWPA